LVSVNWWSGSQNLGKYLSIITDLISKEIKKEMLRAGYVRRPMELPCPL
jgi:hypothetical protein